MATNIAEASLTIDGIAFGNLKKTMAGAGCIKCLYSSIHQINPYPADKVPMKFIQCITLLDNFIQSLLSQVYKFTYIFIMF